MSNIVNIESPENNIVSVVIDPIMSVSFETGFVVNKGTESGNGTKFDAYKEHSFSNLSWSGSNNNYTMTVNHNLGKNPSVQVIDSANNIVNPQITFVNPNTITLSSNSIFSGKIYFN